MRIKMTLLAPAAAMALPLFAQAQPINGLYIGAGVGGNFLNGTNISIDGVGDYISPDFSWGYAGLLSIGWGFGNGFRVEIEGSYRRNDTQGVVASGESMPGARGTASSYGGMVNILHDIDINGALGGLTPYLGAGIGYIWHDYDKVGWGIGVASETFSGNAGALAGQAIAGLSLPISAVPGLSLTAEYRFMATKGHDMSGTFNASAGAGIMSSKMPFDVDNSNHSILFGLRYAFNAAPVVATAASPTTAQTYLVFFDWDKAELTDRARRIIGEAASARGNEVIRIEVNGHTDRSGSDQYNQGLSVRRANAVAAELLRRGVPRNEIVTRGFGESNPLLPTADGVRERQNRRVEIILK